MVIYRINVNSLICFSDVHEKFVIRWRLIFGGEHISVHAGRYYNKQIEKSYFLLIICTDFYIVFV